MTPLDAALILLGPVALTVLLLLTYIFYKGAFAIIVTPTRIRLAEEGEALLARTDLSDDERNFVEFALDNACDWRPMLVALLAAPVLALVAVYKKNPWRKETQATGLEVSNKISRRFFINTFASFLAASPILGLFFIVGFSFYCAIAIVFLKSSMIVESSLKTILDADAKFIAHRTRGSRRSLRVA